MHVALPEAEPLVRCLDVSIGYATQDAERVPVVRNVSFDLQPGEALGIVGESGSGKSTLARALLGYRRSGSVFLGGSVSLRGTDLLSAPEHVVRGLRGIAVSMVPQNPLSSLTFHRRVGDQVIEVLRTRAGLDRASAGTRMLALLSRTGLPDPASIARRFPHQLSGGQRQRVVIAAALACDPVLMVLDEPTTALDKTTEAQVLALIAELRRQSGAALVLVTHDLNVVARVCDRVLVMKDGEVVEDGPVARVFGSPRSPYARSLLDAALVVDAGAACVPPPADSSPLLRVSAACFAYARGRAWWRGRATQAPALDRIDLQIGRGDVLGVIGESGSGKSTLGMLVAGLMAPDSGSLSFDGTSLGTDVAKRSAEQRRRIQMIFQDPLSSLNPRQTVGTAIARPMHHFFGLRRDEARARAAALLLQLGMGEHFLDRFPRQLSGGQQQRVAIARAFAARPDLLICDEITSALDASIQAQVLGQLSAMQRESAAAMMVITHDLSVIWKMAPRVIVLRGGRIIEAGDTATVFTRPRDPYTATLLESATRATRMSSAARPA
jgi:peptide/nickel transport system ATP-binding protein